MKVYLCGGINGLSEAQCRDWREVAKETFPDAIDPMRRDYRVRENSPGVADEIVQGDIDDIKGCDVLLVNATRPSWGTAMEMVYAKQASKPCHSFVLGPLAPVSPWLRAHSVAVYLCLQDAIRGIMPTPSQPNAGKGANS